MRNRSISSKIQKRYPVYQAARRYVEFGICVFPVHTDGTRHPSVKWGEFQDRRPSDAELRRWYRCAEPFGIAILTGPVSKNLVAFDFDDIKTYRRWKHAVQEQLPSVWNKFVIVKTPSGGRHVYVRCDYWIDARPGLAYRRTATGDLDLSIEFYQEKHFLVGPGSPAGVHRLAKEYRRVSQRDFDDISTLKRSIVEKLVAIARLFDERPRSSQRPRARKPQSPRASSGNRPGDLFNAKATWSEILEPLGWEFVSESRGIQYWRRPGKGEAHSATINYRENDRLHVFSGNATALEQDTSYSKFEAFAHLHYGGDFSAAAAELARRGYHHPAKHPTTGTVSSRGSLHAARQLLKR